MTAVATLVRTLSELAPVDAAHVSLRIFPGATHIFDSFAGDYEFSHPGANRRQGESFMCDLTPKLASRRATT